MAQDKFPGSNGRVSPKARMVMVMGIDYLQHSPSGIPWCCLLPADGAS